MKRFFRHESREERTLVVLSFLSLFGILCGHTLLETARDALFVTRIPLTRLPIVYIAIAVVGVITSRLAGVGSRRTYAISAALLFAAIVDMAFWFMLDDRSGFVVYAFYVWTGVFASWIITTFWIVLAPALTITQAKRLYGPIGAGSLLGAVAGSGAARLILSAPGLRKLLLASAMVSTLTALVPAAIFGRHIAKQVAPPSTVKRERAAEAARAPFQSRYVLGVLVLVLIATAIGTFADYVLKNEVLAHVQKVNIGPFFAAMAFWTNLAALGLQLFFLNKLLKLAGVHRALALIPLLFLTLSTAGFLLPAFLTIILIKGTDGSLRTSLLKTGTELFLFPLDDDLRPRAKVAVDLFGQRVGQAIASVAILGFVAVHAPSRALLGAIAVLALAWLLLLPGLRKGYLELFRKTLEAGEIQLDFEIPPPDLESLEAILGALNSSRDGEVLAALDLLRDQGKASLIPALILFHPSARVVTHALDILEANGRHDLEPVLLRLHAHPDGKVRAAALRALSTLDTSNGVLERHLEDPDPRVRATAVIALARRGALDDKRLSALAIDEDPKQRHALQTGLLRAIRRQPDPRFVPLALMLAQSTDRGVLVEAARAMGALEDPSCIPALIGLLAYGDPREQARQALVRYGVPALKELAATFADKSKPYPVRKHIPRTIAAFDPPLAATALLVALPQTHDFVLGLRLLRGLRQIQKRRPAATRATKLYERMLRERFLMVHHYRAWRASLESRDTQHTPAFELLSGLLREKESTLEEHVFSLVGLIDPTEDYETIFRGLHNESPKARSTSRELLENVLPKRVRDEVLVVASEAAPARPPALEATLRDLLKEDSETLSALAAYHAEELGLQGFVPPPNSMPLGMSDEVEDHE
ncbi:MAG: HEAT repeat domain-containing protein [Polyangiaceae bacterium]